MQFGKKTVHFIFFQVLKTQRVCFVLPFYSNSIFLTMIIWLRLMCGQNINTPKKIILVYTKDGIYISTFTFYCYLLRKKRRGKNNAQYYCQTTICSNFVLFLRETSQNKCQQQTPFVRLPLRHTMPILKAIKRIKSKQ